MAGAGPTMLLREENGCCSRRQSSSSAGVRWARVPEEQSGSDTERGGEAGGEDGTRGLQFPAAPGLRAPPSGLLGAVVLRACSRACASE